MQGIRLKNVRSLVDTGMLAIRPITVLLGQNSSGKSTFLRTFPLLSQSVSTRSNSPILWYGDSVDFGSVSEVLSRVNDADSISIEVDYGYVDLRDRYGMRPASPDTAEQFRLRLDLTEVGERTSLCGFRLATSDHELVVKLGERGAIETVYVNGEDYLEFLPPNSYRFDTTSFVPQLRPRPGTNVAAQELFGMRVGGKVGPAIRAISKIYGSYLHGRTTEQTLYQLSRRLNYATGEKFFNNLKVNRQNLKSWYAFRQAVEAGPESRLARKLQSLVLLADLPEILFAIQRQTSFIGRDTSYVGPSRATGERYYRIQELAIDAIDPQGKNLAMWLHSLTAGRLNQFSAWLSDAIGYEITVDRSSGHVQIKLRPMGGGSYYNIADMGYGFSQILPVMAQIWLRIDGGRPRRIGQRIQIAIEQPELHLHPAYQALFADTVAGAINTGSDHIPTSVIIETHSEAIVNRFGELISQRRLDHRDVAIYIFDKPDENLGTELREVYFDAEGILENWPIGFFSARLSK